MEQQAAAESGPPSFAAGYRPRPGGMDEMVGPDGRIRPLWLPLIDKLDRFSPAEIDTRFARADQYLREAGVYYRAYGSGGSDAREWPLSHVPLLIEESEWEALAAGLVQRAELLERVFSDIYGENRLVEGGLLPPQIIAASPEYLRPVAGLKFRGAPLHFLAFELGRGPDGRWWVLADRTQAPSGAGFAVENRVATLRAFSELLVDMNVHRLAGFFRSLRDTLLGLGGGEAAILTPGQANETYFEHAYIARYLGLMLLEGSDLTIADGKVMVRTVEGPREIGVLWRRLDSAFMDPLELNPESRIGTPGFVEALRRGGATLVNALGSGILETRALMAFLPAISRHLDDTDLVLPHIATWWCGSKAEREHVIADLDRMMVGPALSTIPPFEDGEGTRLADWLGAEDKAGLVARLRGDGAQFVAQEAVTLSTMPTYAHGRLEPRPVTLRAFAMRTANGWTVMPGGLARVGASADTTAIAMQKGGRAADVWIVGARPVERVSLLPSEEDAVEARISAILPSRAADNLFWIGRYIERADSLVRVLRAYHGRIAEAVDPRNPTIPAIRAALREIGIDERDPIPPRLIANIDAAADSAGRIRDRFSADGWLALTDLSKTVHRFADTVEPGGDASRAMTVLLRKLAGFAGLVHENMYRGTGWRFLEIGRRLERALEMSRLASHLTAPGAPLELLDLFVEIGDSVMTHRRLHKVNSGRLAVIGLLALDEANPRSIVFQLAEMKADVDALPAPDGGGHTNPVKREALRLHTGLAVREPAEVAPEFLKGLASSIAGLSDLIDIAYFR
jgi:uncharacterized circularly permuted ATP-grasp superfamily protein/uncharacterized alpha-E superfamily protein